MYGARWSRPPRGTWRKIVAAGTAEERAAARAAKLAAIYDEQRRNDKWLVKQHVLRKMTLDLVCEAFPPGHPPPDAILDLLRRALELPDDHEVGDWPLTAGLRDDRGGVDHEARDAAMLLDNAYRLKPEHDGKEMTARACARLVEKELGRKCSHVSINRWRKEPGYWAEYEADPPGSKPRPSEEEK